MKIKKSDKETLYHILIELLGTIHQIRKEDDFYILEKNEVQAREWITYLQEHDEIEELEELENQVKDALYYHFGEPLSESNLDERRIELMNQYVEQSYKLVK